MGGGIRVNWLTPRRPRISLAPGRAGAKSAPSPKVTMVSRPGWRRGRGGTSAGVRPSAGLLASGRGVVGPRALAGRGAAVVRRGPVAGLGAGIGGRPRAASASGTEGGA